MRAADGRASRSRRPPSPREAVPSERLPRLELERVDGARGSDAAADGPARFVVSAPIPSFLSPENAGKTIRDHAEEREPSVTSLYQSMTARRRQGDPRCPRRAAPGRDAWRANDPLQAWRARPGSGSGRRSVASHARRSRRRRDVRRRGPGRWCRSSAAWTDPMPGPGLPRGAASGSGTLVFDDTSVR